MKKGADSKDVANEGLFEFKITWLEKIEEKHQI